MGAIRTTPPATEVGDSLRGSAARGFVAPQLGTTHPLPRAVLIDEPWETRIIPPASHPSLETSDEYCAVCDQFIWRAQQSTINACATLLLIAYRSSLIADCLSLIPAHDKVYGTLNGGRGWLSFVPLAVGP